MMKVGLSGIITPSEWTFEETLEKARDAGYEAFEICFRDDRDTKFDDLTDARIAEIFEGTNEIQRIVIASNIFRQHGVRIRP